MDLQLRKEKRIKGQMWKGAQRKELRGKEGERKGSIEKRARGDHFMGHGRV